MAHLIRTNRYLTAHLLTVRWTLFLTGLAKVYSATGSAKVLEIPEALLPMSIRQALWLVGLIELIIALYLWLGGNHRVKLVWVAWLGGNFVLYRLAAFLMTVGKPCPCLGSITEKLHLNQAAAEHILGAVAVYMLFSSLFFLLATGKGTPSLNHEQNAASAFGSRVG